MSHPTASVDGARGGGCCCCGLSKLELDFRIDFGGRLLRFSAMVRSVVKSVPFLSRSESVVRTLTKLCQRRRGPVPVHH